MKKIKIILVTLLLFTSSASIAKEGLYIGANYGQAKADVDLEFFGNVNRYTFTDVDDTDSSLSLLIGYQLTSYISLEGGYIDFGSVSSEVEQEDDFFLFAVNDRLEVDGMFYNIKAQLPVSGNINLYGKIGVLKWEANLSHDIKFDGDSDEFNRSDDGTDSFYGVGASFAINESIELIIDYSKYDIDHSKVRLRLEKALLIENISVGLLFRF